MKSSRIRWAWLAWLVAFLAIELPAWLSERKGGVKTLSRHVWRYYASWPKRTFLALFLFTLSAHFLLGPQFWFSGAAAIVLTGIPVFVLFVAGVVND